MERPRDNEVSVFWGDTCGSGRYLTLFNPQDKTAQHFFYNDILKVQKLSKSNVGWCHTIDIMQF